jgi:EF hand
MRHRLLPILLWTFAAPAFADPAAIGGKLFDRLDADGDGIVTLAEITTAKAAQFARLDANEDGILSTEERARSNTRRARFGAAARNPAGRQDKDGDANLTRAEYTATGPLFALLDINGDTNLSRAEFDRAITAFSN